jgi:hypothetical protein
MISDGNSMVARRLFTIETHNDQFRA